MPLFGVDRNKTGLIDAPRCQRDLRLRQRCLRLLVVIPQLEQQLAFLDFIALLDAQKLDTATNDGRQLGALAGLDRAGASIGQRRFDLARGNLLEHDRDRLGSCKPGNHPNHKGKNDNNNNQSTHENPYLKPGSQPDWAWPRTGSSVP